MGRLALLVAVLVFVVIACGAEATPVPPGETPASTQAPAPTATTAATATPTTEAVAPEPAAAATDFPVSTATPEPTRRLSGAARSQIKIVEDATLLRLGSEPPSLDPHLTVDATSALYIVEVFGGLVTIDRDLEIVGDLAKDWDISNGGRTYTFHLREDAKFHDGRPVTAQDFKWSMERIADPETQAPVVDVFLGDIVGFSDKLEGRAESVAGIQVIDDHTLSLTIDAPKAFFLAKLTYPTGFVLDRANVESSPSWFRQPNGTGPFRLKEYVPGEVLRLTRNESYHLGPPKLGEVRFILSGGDEMLMYQNDEIHVTGVSLLFANAIVDPSNPLSKEILPAPPQFDVAYLGMNANEPPFDDPKVRLALNYAVDRQTLTDLLYEGYRLPAKGILPPSFPGYNPDAKGYEYDPDKARQLLLESKYGDNLEEFPRIVLTLPGSFGASVSPVMEAVIQYWRENLGIEMEILQTEWAIFLQDLYRNRFQMFGGLGWIADYPDPHTFLDVLFHTDSSVNNTKYSNPDVDQLLELARVELDEDARFEIYHQVEEIVLADAPWVPLWHGSGGFVLLKPTVKDYQLFPLVIPRFRYVYITEE